MVSLNGLIRATSLESTHPKCKNTRTAMLMTSAVQLLRLWTLKKRHYPVKRLKLRHGMQTKYLQRKRELTNVLNKEKINIAIISETPQCHANTQRYINYSLYTCNHYSSTSHGSAAIYIHRLFGNNEAK